jgi:hypothetical protein
VIRIVLVCLALVSVTACGEPRPRTAAALRSCVAERLPRDAVDRVVVSEEAGVTSLNYFHHGAEVDVSVFATDADAIAAEQAEARLGDAHDRRIGNVLYGGGGVVEAAVVHCAR